jgi:GT2 family glycosyltransferase
MGKKVVYFSGAKARHHGGRSIPGQPASALEYRKSQLYLYRKQRMPVSLFLLKKYLKFKYTIKLKKVSARDPEQSGNERRIVQEILALLD